MATAVTMSALLPADAKRRAATSDAYLAQARAAYAQQTEINRAKLHNMAVPQPPKPPRHGHAGGGAAMGGGGVPHLDEAVVHARRRQQGAMHRRRDVLHRLRLLAAPAAPPAGRR